MPQNYIFLACALLLSSCAAKSQTPVDFGAQGTGVEEVGIAAETPNDTNNSRLAVQVGGRNGAYYGLYRFDLSSLQGSFTDIAGAKLKFHVNLKRGKWTDKKFNLYRISDANKSWSAGKSSTNKAENGAASWNYRSYSSIVDPKTGELTGTRWSGTPGLSTPTTDYLPTPIASATISSTIADGAEVTFDFSDVSFFKDWINNPRDNAGFLISSPDLAGEAYSYIAFENSKAKPESRPRLQLEVNGYKAAASWKIPYTLPKAAQVSLVIFDQKGQVVRELLHGAPKPAGANGENWDGKDDAGKPVANGNYNWKLLSTQGIIAQYQLSVGTNSPVPSDLWPGNHAAVAAIATDNSGVYFAGGEGEGPPLLVKTDANGKRIWTAPIHWSEPWMGGWSLSADAGKIYLRQQNGKVQVYASDKAPEKPLQTLDLLYAKTDSVDPDTGQRDGMDMCVRGGKMLVSYRNHNAVRWVNPADGSVIKEVSISAPEGVALSSDGATAYVCSGDSILKYASPTAEPTIFQKSAAGAKPYRLDVAAVSGEVVIAFGGADPRVRRYDSNGKALGVTGTPGGRARNGVYNPNGFVQINDIAFAPDGSWWIAEPAAAPFRAGHFSANGVLQKEFYGGFTYAAFAGPDPANPNQVWMSDFATRELMQTDVNYAAKTWKVGAIYSTDNPLLPRLYYGNQMWQITHRGGKTYLCSRHWPIVFRLEGATLKPCAIAGPATDNDGKWLIPAPFQTADSPKPRMFSWSDLNDDGIAQPNEVTYDPRRIESFSQSGMTASVGDDFSYTNVFSTGYQSLDGPGVLAPARWTTGGAPVYSWADLKHPTDGFPAAMKHGVAGFWRDKAGDYYGAYNLELKALKGAAFGNGFWSPRAGGNKIVKWSSDGKLQWMVGIHAPGGNTEPGQMRYLWGIAGTAHDCVFVQDVEQSLVHIYDKDGLYVGHVLDVHPDNLPKDAYELCGENFSGAVYENSTNGETLYFGGGDNSSHVYKLSGWDSFARQNGTVAKN